MMTSFLQHTQAMAHCSHLAKSRCADRLRRRKKKGEREEWKRARIEKDNDKKYGPRGGACESSCQWICLNGLLRRCMGENLDRRDPTSCTVDVSELKRQELVELIRDRTDHWCNRLGSLCIYSIPLARCFFDQRLIRG
jgi:hypothetical protein